MERMSKGTIGRGAWEARARGMIEEEAGQGMNQAGSEMVAGEWALVSKVKSAI